MKAQFDFTIKELCCLKVAIDEFVKTQKSYGLKGQQPEEFLVIAESIKRKIDASYNFLSDAIKSRKKVRNYDNPKTFHG